MSSLAFSYRLGESTVACIIKETCDAINGQMIGTYMPPPTEDDWREIAHQFLTKWNFPNCIGAIDGKHVYIKAPPNSGTLYWNYKKTFSIVLMALVDANKKFRVVHMGEYGKSNDGGVFGGSLLGRGLEAGTLHVPEDAVIPGAERLGPMPFSIVGDAAFPHKTYLMKPYATRALTGERRIFNYRLSRARNVVENALGILASRWEIFARRIKLSPDKVDAIVLSACILHNYLSNPRENQRWLEEFGATEMEDAGSMGGNRAGQGAHDVRDKLCQYFSSPQGRVPWQERMA